MIGSILLAGGGAAEARVADSLQFHLVPVEFWSEPANYPLHTLPGGKISFYRSGESIAAFQADAGEKVRLPPGQWIFTAEAPGYVGIAAGEVNMTGSSEEASEGILRENEGAATAKSIYWWVVPACQISLRGHIGEEADQGGYISLKYGIRTPFSVAALGSGIQAPSGETILYLAKKGVILGMSQIFSCHAGDSVTTPRVAPPPEGHFDLLLIYRREQDREKKTLKSLSLSSPGLSSTQNPSLQISNSRETLVIFRNVPLAADWQVTDSGRKEALFAAGMKPQSGKVYELTLDPG